MTKPKVQTIKAWNFCAIIDFIEKKYKIDADKGIPSPDNIPGKRLYADVHPSVWHWLTNREFCDVGVDKIFYIPVGYWGPSDEGTQEELAPEGLKHVGKFLDLLAKEFADKRGDLKVYYTK